jgi:16S rRNA (guanine(966)-N(2))-methyltransferase RsmD
MDRVKTALFDILSTQVEDAHFLDLFAGTGSVGIEALSRGAQHATFIEMNHTILKLVRENLQITQLADHAETLHSDAFKFLQAYQIQRPSQDTQTPHIPVLSSIAGQQRTYDIIYVAPPQYEELAARALFLIDNSTLIAKEGLVIVQIHPKERAGVAAVECQQLVLTEERRYGSTLLMFYQQQVEEGVGHDQ